MKKLVAYFLNLFLIATVLMYRRDIALSEKIEFMPEQHQQQVIDIDQ